MLLLLPHVAELSSTTRGMSQEIQSKVKSNYIDPTKDLAKEKYDAIVKPTTDKLQSCTSTQQRLSLTKPTNASPLSMKNNLSKSESVPKAIVSTGWTWAMPPLRS
ncbi:AIF_collapsed_G0032090.mRNA.1.CDS.1 [Saccharomyces cerevisiae]|nr:AIF_collapsed_G0032090.mRNA.1.CDS.1 [Saccharomyces cerevisiae]